MATDQRIAHEIPLVRRRVMRWVCAHIFVRLRCVCSPFVAHSAMCVQRSVCVIISQCIRELLCVCGAVCTNRLPWDAIWLPLGCSVCVCACAQMNLHNSPQSAQSHYSRAQLLLYTRTALIYNTKHTQTHTDRWSIKNTWKNTLPHKNAFGRQAIIQDAIYTSAIALCRYTSSNILQTTIERWCCTVRYLCRKNLNVCVRVYVLHTLYVQCTLESQTYVFLHYSKSHIHFLLARRFIHHFIYYVYGVFSTRVCAIASILYYICMFHTDETSPNRRSCGRQSTTTERRSKCFTRLCAIARGLFCVCVLMRRWHMTA